MAILCRQHHKNIKLLKTNSSILFENAYYVVKYLFLHLLKIFLVTLNLNLLIQKSLSIFVQSFFIRKNLLRKLNFY